MSDNSNKVVNSKSWENIKKTRYYINNKADVILKAAAAKTNHRPGDLIEHLIIKHLSSKAGDVEQLVENAKSSEAQFDAMDVIDSNANPQS